jgi:hypothetical protein
VATPFAPSPAESSRSIREPWGRLANEDRVCLPDYLDRVGRGARLMRRGQRQALAGGEHGDNPHWDSVLRLFGKGGDDTKTVALDRVVGDPRHIAEVDDLTLEGLQPFRMGRADGRQRERGGKGGLLDIRAESPAPSSCDERIGSYIRAYAPYPAMRV